MVNDKRAIFGRNKQIPAPSPRFQHSWQHWKSACCVSKITTRNRPLNASKPEQLSSRLVTPSHEPQNHARPSCSHSPPHKPATPETTGGASLLPAPQPRSDPPHRHGRELAVCDWRSRVTQLWITPKRRHEAVNKNKTPSQLDFSLSKEYIPSMTPSPPSDSPEAALARYLATVNARLAQKRELRQKLEDAKIQKQRRPFWWLKD